MEDRELVAHDSSTPSELLPFISRLRTRTLRSRNNRTIGDNSTVVYDYFPVVMVVVIIVIIIIIVVVVIESVSRPLIRAIVNGESQRVL